MVKDTTKKTALDLWIETHIPSERVRRLIWFWLLWAASLLTVAALAYILKAVLALG